ncbi:PfkB family carbohydrate kinase, partial [Teichococcus cervicalis]
LAKRLAVTLGHEGALLATAAGTLRLPALPVEVRGAVGAGDSFVAAMTLALARGATDEDAFAWGMAAGAAAVSNAGTAHPTRAEVEQLRARLHPAPPG